jgi:hypothetical protein
VADSTKKTLADYWVPWSTTSPVDIARFRDELEGATGEAEMQAFLERHPEFLCQHLPAARGYWVIPTKRLGSEHITDFLVGEDTPHQPTWYAVELERPQALLFTQRGDPSAALTHAMRQIDDWRTWLSRNRDYASRAPEWAGLGLGDIDPELEGLVIIGRGSTLDTAVEDRRRRLARANRMRIETYDWLITQAENRAKLPLPDPWSGASPSEHGEDSFVEHPFVEHLVTCRVGHEYVVGSRSGGYPEEYGMWGWPEYCPECGLPSEDMAELLGDEEPISDEALAELRSFYAFIDIRMDGESEAKRRLVHGEVIQCRQIDERG